MSKTRIYVVDDNIAVCHAFKFLLHSFYKLEVIIYDNPLQFLEELSIQWQGCLILDKEMPVVNGITLLKTVKKYNPKINVIMMSGDGTNAAVTQSIAAGARSFISKPFATDELLKQVTSILMEYERP